MIIFQRLNSMLILNFTGSSVGFPYKTLFLSVKKTSFEENLYWKFNCLICHKQTVLIASVKNIL